MSNKAPTPPPSNWKSGATSQGGEANIADMRDTFARKTPLTAEELARALAFIDGKIEMVRSDPHMKDEEKAAAIADLESRRWNLSNSN